MNPTLKNILTTLATALIIGNFAFLFQVNARLASIEAQIKFLTDANYVRR